MDAAAESPEHRPRAAGGRRLWPLVALVFALALVFVLALVAVQVRAPDEDRSARIGLSTHLVASGEPVDEQLRTIAGAGVGWIREDFFWRTIEPEPGELDWSRYDELMGAAADQGVDVLAILDYSAPWASSDPGGDERHPPADVDQFAAYARAVVDRYGRDGAFWRTHGGIARPLRAVEIWNEPWGYFFWKPEPDPAAYARLARAAAQAVRDAGRDVDVLVAADVLQVRTDGQIAPWFEALLDADPDLPELVDAWSVHPYPSPRDLAPTAAGDDERFAFSRVELTEEIARRRDAERPIWITEVGWSTAPETDGVVTEAEQAAFFDQALRRSLEEWSDEVARIFLYSFDRDGSDPGDREAYYGVRRADGSFKPAWDVIKRWTAQ